MGRPSKLTDELEADLLEALRAGAYIEAACDLVGISRTTFYAWQERGEAGQEPFATFLVEVRKARSQATVEALRVIQEAAERSWRAAAWYLERTHPEHYGRRAVAAPTATPPPQDHRADELRALAQAALEAARNR